MSHASWLMPPQTSLPRAVLPALRTVVLASADTRQRERLRDKLSGMRWQVHEAAGGAAAMVVLEELRPEALLIDEWLPDLEAGEFAVCVQALYPETELLRMDGSTPNTEARSPRRQELLQALRELSEEAATDGWRAGEQGMSPARVDVFRADRADLRPEAVDLSAQTRESGKVTELLPEMVGKSEVMEELGRLVRLVAPRSTTVLIEGETGTGKELVAKALHRLSSRANKPFAVLNCAAIPEALLEAELFGHTRGAFTGAVRSRIGRIEAADGGTLFLDEIGEMPLALQAKMLRFLECGELQRVGDNEPMHVDVRVIAATHQPLEQRAAEQTFRLDLYHRLAVFPIEVPTLRSRLEDVPLLAEHFLTVLDRGATAKQISSPAVACLQEHHWPGNVRELMHVLERGIILTGLKTEIGEEEIRIRKRDRSS